MHLGTFGSNVLLSFGLGLGSIVIKPVLAIAATLIFSLFISQAVEAKAYKVCTVEVPGGMTADKSGPQPLMDFYEEVIKRVSDKTGHSFELMFAPASRCIHMFGLKEISIMWPFIMAQDKKDIEKVGYTEFPLYSMPIISTGHLIFTRKEQPALNSIDDLAGKSVVSARGYGLPEAYESSEKIIKTLVNNNEQVARMIIAGRVDAGIIQSGWLPSLQQLGLLEHLHHGAMIDFWGGSFAIQHSSDGAILTSIFSNIILELVVNGTYEKLMKGAPYAIPAYSLPTETSH